MNKQIPSSVHIELKKLIQKYTSLDALLNDIIGAGGIPYLVGGSVRDLFLERPIIDIDIEVHKLTLESLSTLLKKYGPVDVVGKSFGVLKVHTIPVDWSLPRLDAAGRKPQVTISPDLPIERALIRRDLTMNAMAIDLKNNQLIDPFDGLADVHQKILRAPDAAFFQEDPLRLFRVMQFIGRFEMFPDQKLNDICSTMSLNGVSSERIEKEFEKLFLLSKKPSLGIRWLSKINRLKEILPELYKTIGVQQDSRWHPEGDVFEHTMQVVDAAAEHEYDSSEEKLKLLYAALCHDLGKIETTRIVGDKITSYEHEIKGVPLAADLLKHVTRQKNLIDTVKTLVRHHMAPGMFAKHKAQPRAYKKLAYQLAPLATLKMLAFLAHADRRGRNPLKHVPLPDHDPLIQEFIETAKQVGVFTAPEPPIIQGRDLLSLIEPGPALKNAVERAYMIQIEKNIHDKKELVKRAMDGVSSLERKKIC